MLRSNDNQLFSGFENTFNNLINQMSQNIQDLKIEFVKFASQHDGGQNGGQNFQNVYFKRIYFYLEF